MSDVVCEAVKRFRMELHAAWDHNRAQEHALLEQFKPSIAEINRLLQGITASVELIVPEAEIKNSDLIVEPEVRSKAVICKMMIGSGINSFQARIKLKNDTISYGSMNAVICNPSSVYSEITRSAMNHFGPR